MRGKSLHDLLIQKVYSDGYERDIQTRAQAEEVNFEEYPFWIFR